MYGSVGMPACTRPFHQEPLMGYIAMSITESVASLRSPSSKVALSADSLHRDVHHHRRRRLLTRSIAMFMSVVEVAVAVLCFADSARENHPIQYVRMRSRASIRY